MSVTYTDSQKDKIQIQYQEGLNIAQENDMPEHLAQIGISGMAESIPVVKINNKLEPEYRQWPMIESPEINMDENVLRIHEGTSGIVVDWQQDYPAIIKQTN